jgi:hypothetical protein
VLPLPIAEEVLVWMKLAEYCFPSTLSYLISYTGGIICIIRIIRIYRIQGASKRCYSYIPLYIPFSHLKKQFRPVFYFFEKLLCDCTIRNNCLKHTSPASLPANQSLFQINTYTQK